MVFKSVKEVSTWGAIMSKKNDKINIDGTEYSLADLSDNVKSHLASLKFTEDQLQQLHNELAIADTARIGYTNALKAELAKTSSSNE